LCDLQANRVQKNLPFCTFSLTAANFARFLLKNWNSRSFGFMAKVKKRKEIACQDRKTFISFASFLKASQLKLTALICLSEKSLRREETLPSLPSSFRRPTFIGSVRSSLCAIF